MASSAEPSTTTTAVASCSSRSRTGQQLSDHTASSPAILEVVDGQADISVAGEHIDGRPGTWLHMEADTPHGIVARTPLTLLLTLLKGRG